MWSNFNLELNISIFFLHIFVMDYISLEPCLKLVLFSREHFKFWYFCLQDAIQEVDIQILTTKIMTTSTLNTKRQSLQHRQKASNRRQCRKRSRQKKNECEWGQNAIAMNWEMLNVFWRPKNCGRSFTIWKRKWLSPKLEGEFERKTSYIFF